MGESQLRAHRLLIVPGGNFVTMGKGLSPATAANVRNAVKSGLNYLGICVGAFLAGSSQIAPPFHGLNLTSGVAFPFYGAEAQGIRKTAAWVQAAGEPPLQHYWEDGPALIGWGDVVGKYPDGTPAIVEASVGEGWVILSGVHPEAPESWRGGINFMTPARLDNAYAARLIDAADAACSLLSRAGVRTDGRNFWGSYKEWESTYPLRLLSRAS
jgi:glutamine amidotransferase PdxT